MRFKKNQRKSVMLKTNQNTTSSYPSKHQKDVETKNQAEASHGPTTQISPRNPSQERSDDIFQTDHDKHILPGKESSGTIEVKKGSGPSDEKMRQIPPRETSTKTKRVTQAKPSKLEKLNAQIDSNLYNNKRDLATEQHQQWSDTYLNQSIEAAALKKISGLKKSNTYTDPPDHKRAARTVMNHTKENFRDDQFSRPNSRDFPGIRQFVPPERVRGLEPETKMTRNNTVAANKSLDSHVAGAAHRKASSFWTRHVKQKPETSAKSQIEKFLHRSGNLTVQRKTGPGTKDRNDLSKGEIFVYKDPNNVGIEFAKRQSSEGPDIRTFVGLLEPSNKDRGKK